MDNRQGAPLDGVRVLEFAQLFPGPYAGLVLASLGAEVIKVEPPTGDPTRSVPPFVEQSGGGAGAVFCALNRCKRSVVLDLKQDQAVETFHELARSARIVLDGYRAGVAERLGVGFDQLAEDRDDLVHVSLTGFGAEGPLAQEPGHDITYQAWMGGIDPGTPHPPNLPTADASSGLWAALLAVAHLRLAGNHRLDTSLAGSLAASTLIQNSQALQGAPNPLTGALPGYQVYACAEGELLALGALEPGFWRAACRVLGDPTLEQQGHPPDPEPSARERLAEHLATQPRPHWLRTFREAGVPCAPVRSSEEAVAKPLELSSWDPPGASTREDLTGAPGLGEHTGEVLDELTR